MTTDLMDLEEELPRRERRQLVTPVGIAAVAVVIGAAGFFGGVHVQKSRGGTTGGNAGAAGRFAGGFGGTGGTGTAGGTRTGGGAAAAGAAGGTGATRGAGAGAGTGGGGATGGAADGTAAGGAAGGATVGSVSSVDGSTLYVDDSSGTTVKVKVAKGGTVTRTAKAAAKAIHPGDTVIVQGEASSSGTITASSVRATASNAAGAAFGGGFGGFGGGGAPGAQGTSGGG